MRSLVRPNRGKRIVVPRREDNARKNVLSNFRSKHLSLGTTYKKRALYQFRSCRKNKFKAPAVEGGANKSNENEILSIFESPREFLMHEDNVQLETCSRQTIPCPEIKISVENIEVSALFDTGSKITCISAQLYEEEFEH